MKIAHVINPVVVGEQSDLYVAQPVTFRSMEAAKAQARVDVELFAVCYEEDTALVPDTFTQLPLLTESVLDHGEFEQKKKLPLIQDILSRLVDATDAEYCVYTNVDIATMPFFYDEVARRIEAGVDALVINRRTIEASEQPADDLTVYYAQSGEPHPGFDCFVFRREVFKHYLLGQACIGANWIGRVLIANLIAFSNRFELLEDAHLTFHLGDDQSWRVPENTPLDDHNEQILVTTLLHLRRLGLVDRHDFLKETYLKFITNNKKRSSDAWADTGIMTPTREPLDTSRLFKNTKYNNGWDGHGDIILHQAPVFVVGFPRSGTSLTYSMLAAASGSAVLPETHFFNVLIKQLSTTDKGIVTGERLDDALRYIKTKLVISEDLEAYVRERVEAGFLSLKMLFEVIVFDQISRQRGEAKFTEVAWMEKTPFHAFETRVIDRFYPGARYLCVVRNPEKAILSRRHNFRLNDEDLWPIAKHAQQWLDVMKAVDGYRDQHPDRMTVIRYEDLVADPESVVSSACHQLGLPFTTEGLNGYRELGKSHKLDWESWKEDVERELDVELARAEQALSNKDKQKLYRMTRKQLKRHGYDGDYSDVSGTSMLSSLWRA